MLAPTYSLALSSLLLGSFAACVGTNPSILPEQEGGTPISDASQVETTLVCDAGTACGAECVSLSSNRLNCGACGRVCEGDCTDGACGTVTVASFDGLNERPQGIAIDDNFVFITTWPTGPGIDNPLRSQEGRVLYKKKSDLGAAVTEVANTQFMPDRIARVGPLTCWSNWYPGGTLRCAQISLVGVVQNTPYGDATGKYVSMAVFGDSLFSGRLSNPDGSGGSIHELGNFPGGLRTFVEKQVDLRGVAADQDRVYWSVPDKIRSMPRGPDSTKPTITDHVTGLRLGDAVAVSGDYVYYTDRDLGVAARVSKSGSTALEPLMTGLQGPRSILVEGNALYIAEFDGGRILKIDLTTKKVTTLATGRQPYDLAMDARHLYWTEFSKVARVTK